MKRLLFGLCAGLAVLVTAGTARADHGHVRHGHQSQHGHGRVGIHLDIGVNRHHDAYHGPRYSVPAPSYYGPNYRSAPPSYAPAPYAAPVYPVPAYRAPAPSYYQPRGHDY